MIIRPRWLTARDRDAPVLIFILPGAPYSICGRPTCARQMLFARVWAARDFVTIQDNLIV